jgi:hypothetical protein
VVATLVSDRIATIAPAPLRRPLPASRLSLQSMNLDRRFLQRALLAFTTGLFLACAARVSAADAATVPSGTSAAVR